MILDQNLIFFENSAIASGASDVLDIQHGGDALARELVVVATCPETAAGGTSLKLVLETSELEDFSVAKTLYETPTIPVAVMVAGAKLAAFRMPRGAKRYLRMQQVAEGTFSAGKVSCFMVTGDQVSFGDLE